MGYSYDENVLQNNNTKFINIAHKYVPPNDKEEVEYKKNNADEQLEIYAVSAMGKRLLSTLSYDDFDYRCKIVLTKNNLFFINWGRTELMHFDINTGLFRSTGIPCGNAFDISSDEKFVCVSVENKKLKGFFNTLLPCLYDFKLKSILKEYYFEFLEDEIGIALSITYDDTKNRMGIAYNWDTPTPQFEGFISLDDRYEFVRTK